ncbi:YhgE/Pip domain-containing protein [Leucobacter sp. UT-8R-CII-1-4]|uniref:YhgE/Pip domain-containing protein n=1 Tax=Leucobacter sp. UT-8R-CII-1-4 TaxID=3040075 RepID=UPI0024A9D7FD|nr:YhgE/Pip domain-containing protein [Leucobacter sp. UT-8R-CII-1-4]MDI6022652.1 YhgE/Pip domain-containing protein [Leucobacter sp. UT-8R-CII-1-4]
MNNIIQLYRNDLHQLTRNTIAMVVLFGVVVIPSFFGWFNVLSSWDPFGNVKNLKVAVASADEGYKSEFFPMPVKLGEQVISNLRANSDLNWVFTSEAEAIEGTKSGEYYAALVLPKTFSQDMMTFLSPDAMAGEIEYYSNEKENALSPKITDEAATEVSNTINSSFTKTLDEVALSLISALADKAGSPESLSAVARLSSSAERASDSLGSSAVTLDLFASLLSSSRAILQSASSLADSSSAAANDTAGVLAKGAANARSLQEALRKAAAAIPAALTQTENGYQALINQVNALDASIAQQSQDAVGALNSISSDLGAQIGDYQTLRATLAAQAAQTSDPLVRAALESFVGDLDLAIQRQIALQQRVDQASQKLLESSNGLGADRDEIIALAQQAKAAFAQLRDSYTSSLRPKLDSLANTLDAVQANFRQIRSELGGAASALASGEGSLEAVLTQSETTTKQLAADLREASGNLAKLSHALAKASNSGDFSEVQQLIGDNPAILAGELTSPVGLKRIPVFPVATFGAQMAPFYTVLGLWVGALLLSVLIRTDVAPGTFVASGLVTKTQEYFGRYGVFALLGFFQSSLLYLGLIGFVGVKPVHPFLLLLAGWVMSTVFTLITYTLVLSFGEAGKALAVFLLVVQISAGGGAYPLSVLPQWFQSISPWLPVSHATSAVRSAIAGIYQGDYWIYLGQLALFLLPALLIGLVLRLPALKLNANLTHALESTKLM